MNFHDPPPPLRKSGKQQADGALCLDKPRRRAVPKECNVASTCPYPPPLPKPVATAHQNTMRRHTSARSGRPPLPIRISFPLHFMFHFIA